MVGGLQYVPGTYLGSSLPSHPSLPLLPTRYRLTATSPLQIDYRVTPGAANGPATVVFQACSSIDEHQRTTGGHPHDPVQGSWAS